ncbi:hypothetical protein N2152v2_000273 [Parachlorella kessleri]
MDRVAPTERHAFKHNNQTVYEWDQAFSEVNIYIQVPQGVRAKQLDVGITSTHLAVGIRGNPPYLDKDLGGAVKVSESVWTLEDSTLHISLAKAEGGATWAAALAGHELGLQQVQGDQKRLMLERFQAEHPGFDFSSAEFTGSVPDPRTFLSLSAAGGALGYVTSAAPPRRSSFFRTAVVAHAAAALGTPPGVGLILTAPTHARSNGSSSSSLCGSASSSSKRLPRLPGPRPLARGLRCRVLAVSAPQRYVSGGHPAAAGSKAEGSPASGLGAVAVKVVGVGTRGASALNKLVQHGKGQLDALQVAGAELWCVDIDRKVADSVPGAQVAVVPKEGASSPSQGGPLSAEALMDIVGRGASDAGGRGNIGSGDGGLAFVVAPAAAVPGGPQVVIQLVTALRAAGHFTVVALTNPFGFEGAAKAEQAAGLVAALRSSAHLVAVTEQEVLMQAFGDSQLTVAEATDIADNALEHTVRSILQAVQAQEVLKGLRGALMWHGRDLRHFRRLLAPPLQQLLTGGGTAAVPGSQGASSTPSEPAAGSVAVLGRGLAAMPAEVAHQMGGAKALMHLASDAVRAAAESPFLDGALEASAGVLCCLTLPPAGLQVQPQHVRMAVQAAAGALRDVTGPGSDEFVMCAEERMGDAAASNSGKVEVEATLLVLRHCGPPTTTAAAPAASAVEVPGNPDRGPAQNTLPAPGITAGSAQQQQQQRHGRPPTQLPPQPQRLPASTWNALSALAGGSAATARSGGVVKAGATPVSPPTGSPTGPGTPAVKGGARKGPLGSSAPAESSPRQSQQEQQQPRHAQQPPQRGPQQQQQPASKEDSSRPGSPGSNFFQGNPPPAQSRPQQAQQRQPQRQQRAEPAQQPPSPAQQPRVTVGDYLADSLTAQSLDLPPAAARWRQAQRTADQHKLIVWEVDEVEPWEEDAEEEGEEEAGLAGLLKGAGRRLRPVSERRVNLRERMSGILMQDREEAWQQEEEERGGQ